MKKLFILLCLIIGMIISASGQKKSYRVYTKNNETYTLKSVTTQSYNLKSTTPQISIVDSTQWFAPVANLSVLYFNKDGYKVGVIPGLGYGWQYKPKTYTGKNYLLSIQGFFQAGLVKSNTSNVDYTHLTIGPSLGVGVLGGKVIVGYSYQWDLGFDGNPVISSGMFFLSTTLISF